MSESTNLYKLKIEKSKNIFDSPTDVEKVEAYISAYRGVIMNVAKDIIKEAKVTSKLIKLIPDVTGASPIILIDIVANANKEGAIQATVTAIGTGAITLLLTPTLPGIAGAFTASLLATSISFIVGRLLDKGWEWFQDKYDIYSYNFLDKTILEMEKYFVNQNDDFEENSSLIDNDDGILVKDINSNGIIDNGTEFVLDLEQYDINSDGVIDINDSAYSDLKILKGDGNLLSLSEANIASINLQKNNTNITDDNGNIQNYTSTYTTNAGEERLYGDYDLIVNGIDSTPTELVDVPEEIASLPNAEGSGTMYSLHQAMLHDASGDLQTLVENFVSETNDSVRENLIEQILYKWTGCENVA